MQLLYTAYGCENIGEGKFLLPGIPAEADTKGLQKGCKIQVELADGTSLPTTVVNTLFFDLDESVMTRLNVRAEPGFY